MNKTKSVVTLIIITVLVLVLAVFSFWPTKIKMGVRDYSSPVSQFALSIDLAESTNVIFKIDDDATQEEMDAVVAVLGNRLKLIQEKLNVSGIEITDVSVGDGVLSVRLPKDDEISIGTILALIGAQGELVISYGSDEDSATSITPTDIDTKEELKWADCIKSSNAIYDSSTGYYGVSIVFDDNGLQALKSATASVSSDTYIYFMLDGNQITSVSISSQITEPTFQFTGSGLKSATNASTIAVELLLGEYPINVTSTNDYTTSESVFGSDAVTIVYVAVLAAILLVAILFIVKNGPFGLVSVLSFLTYLVIYAMLFAFLPLGQVVSIATVVAFIFGFAMFLLLNCIYAYVLRRQFSSSDKKSFETASKETFSMIWKLLVDVCVVIFIASVAVALIATGSVQAMAVAVAIGTVICLICSVLFTRWFVRLAVSVAENKNKFKIKEVA